MLQPLVALLACAVLAIVACAKLLWPLRKPISLLLSVALIVIDIVLIYVGRNHLWALAVVIVSFYLLFCLYRMANSPIQVEHLRRITLLSSFRICLLMLALGVLGLDRNLYGYNGHWRWIIVGAMQLAIALTLLSSTLRHKWVAKRIQLRTALLDSQAPTLTVAIPARNETEALNNCLRSILSNNYPKLEVMVYDDQSSNPRTPEIIRSFAHDGVIFIAGTDAPDGWLAKNWAYEELLDHSNGEIVLFCGADTRFEPESLRFLVSALVNRRKQVISLLPRDVLPRSLAKRLIQPLRYAWEISLPRRSLNRPPALSTCWLAEAKFLRERGGFKAMRNRVSPESWYAKQALNQDGYSFFEYDGIISDKSDHDQLETAVRIRYPQLRRQPELVGLIAITELAMMLGSIPLFIYGLVANILTAAILGGVSIVCYCLFFGAMSGIAYRKQSLKAYIAWPMAVLLDLYLIHISMWRYEFGTVKWKGRSVTAEFLSRS